MFCVSTDSSIKCFFRAKYAVRQIWITWGTSVYPLDHYENYYYSNYLDWSYCHLISLLKKNTVWKMVLNFPLVASAHVSKQFSWFMIHSVTSSTLPSEFFGLRPCIISKLVITCWAFFFLALFFLSICYVFTLTKSHCNMNSMMKRLTVYYHSIWKSRKWWKCNMLKIKYNKNVKMSCGMGIKLHLKS